MPEFDRENIVSIDVSAKDWIDQATNVRYWSSVIRLIDRNEETFIILTGVHCGWGDSGYLCKSIDLLRKNGYIEEDNSDPDRQGIWSNGQLVKLTYSVEETSYAEMLAWGEKNLYGT